MSRNFKLLLTSVVITSVAMHCEPELIKFARVIDFETNPNPIPVKNKSAIFEFNMTLPPSKLYKKLDSIKVNLAIGDSAIQTLKFEDFKNLTHMMVYKTNSKIGLSDLNLANGQELSAQLLLFRKGKSKSTEYLSISKFLVEEDER